MVAMSTMRKTKNKQAFELLKYQKFIIKTKKNGAYANGELGKKLESNVIDLLKMENDNVYIIVLRDNNNKDKVNGRNDNNVDQLEGPNIYEDANGNSHNYVELYVEDVETKEEHSALELIARLGIRTMDVLIKLTVKEVVDLILEFKIRAPATNNDLGTPYRKSPYHNASKDRIETKAAPPQCLFRFEESKQLVYGVKFSYKSGYLEDVPIYKQNCELISLQDAISKGIVSKVVACIIVEFYEFYKRIGLCKNMRFKQECDGQCWFAEVQCAGGWIQCSKIYEVIRPDLKQLKDIFRNNHNKVAAALEAIIGEEDMNIMMDALKSEGEYELEVSTLQRRVTIKPNMLKVAEVMIGPTVCCMYETFFDIGSDGKQRFLFPPSVAPYKCSVIKNNKFKPVNELLIKFLKDADISYIVTQGQNLFIKSDERGCPFTLIVTSEDLLRIRDRDSNEEISVSVDDVEKLNALLNGAWPWEDACKEFTPRI